MTSSESDAFQTFLNTTSLAKNVFKSERLIYRAVENTAEDKKLLHERMDNDPVNFLLTDARVLRPQTQASSDEMVKALTNTSRHLLAVIVCLPPQTDSPSKDETQATDEKDEQSSKPTPIGFLSLSGQDLETSISRRANLGICMFSGHQGKGYGPEAINWALDWAFAHANLHKVFLGCFEMNSVARSVYERLGFVSEGRKRDHVWFNRRYWDVFEYSMLEHEWEEKRGLTKK
jgi:RimJ/RimL family protein N-acetyltransferase